MREERNQLYKSNRISGSLSDEIWNNKWTKKNKNLQDLYLTDNEIGKINLQK